MHRFAKHFTVAEARALLPQLRRILAAAQRHRAAAWNADQELAASGKARGADLGGARVNRMTLDLLQVESRLRHLQSLGIQLKDLDRGLVDFPHLRQGREVFLCWELEEADVEFWHEIEAGYAGRERL